MKEQEANLVDKLNAKAELGWDHLEQTTNEWAYRDIFWQSHHHAYTLKSNVSSEEIQRDCHFIILS